MRLSEDRRKLSLARAGDATATVGFPLQRCSPPHGDLPRGVSDRGLGEGTWVFEFRFERAGGGAKAAAAVPPPSPASLATVGFVSAAVVPGQTFLGCEARLPGDFVPAFPLDDPSSTGAVLQPDQAVGFAYHLDQGSGEASASALGYEREEEDDIVTKLSTSTP